MYSLPQEIEVWYIIPKIRKELAKELIKKYNLGYEETGKILGISKAAVALYISGKRANKITLSKEIEKEIKESAKKIYNKESNGLKEIQDILKKMKEKKCSCDVCKIYNKEILNYCNCNPMY
jgi:uncharacterized protein